MKRLLVLIACAAFLIGADITRSTGPGASDAVRQPLEQAFALVWEPAFGDLDAGARRAAVRNIVGELFDWPEIARRAVGPAWTKFSARERREFTDRFSHLLERAYLWRLDGYHADDAARFQGNRTEGRLIRWLGETRDGEETVVHAVLPEHQDLPVDFRVWRRGGRWRICDVAFDRVSAVANYRAQFARVLSQASPRDLIDLVASRISGPDEPAAASVRTAPEERGAR